MACSKGCNSLGVTGTPLPGREGSLQACLRPHCKLCPCSHLQVCCIAVSGGLLALTFIYNLAQAESAEENALSAQNLPCCKLDLFGHCAFQS